MRFFFASLSVTLVCSLLPDIAVADETYEEPRIRVAAELGGGYFGLVGTRDTGYLFSAHGRIGTQLNSLFAVVFQGGAGYAVVVYDGEESDTWGGGVIQGSGLAMLTLGGTFELGLGPAVDLYIWGGPQASGPFGEPTFAPGGHARMAPQFPGWKSRRPSFVLGGDMRFGAYPTHYDSNFTPVLVSEVTAGAEWH